MSLPAPVQWLVYQQDYLWFLALTGWAAALAAWWRLARPRSILTWLPIAALAAVTSALVVFSQLVTPVEVKPNAEPWLVWDLVLGAINSSAAAGLWWQLARGPGRWRRAGAILSTLLVVLGGAVRWHDPLLGSGITVVVLLIGAASAMRAGTSGFERGALGGLVLAVCCGPAGPASEFLDLPQRLTEISPLGLLAALCFLGALLGAVLAFTRAPGAVEKFPDLLGLVRLLLLWLCAGLLLAAVMSRWARRNFEQSLLARVQSAAPLIDRSLLSGVLGPEYRLDRLYGFPATSHRKDFYHSAHLAANEPRAISDALSEIELANPDANWALILTLREGLLVSCCASSRLPGLPGNFGIYGPADDAILQAWSSRTVSIVGPMRLFYGDIIQARAPLLNNEGKMLGWLTLDFGVSRWLAAQIQARLLAFAVILLGVALLILGWWQRAREHVREQARLEADTARAASRLKTAFLAKVSHELRTPIQSLLGYSELLRAHVSGNVKASAWLSSLQQHGELMIRLVNDLIDLSAVESGSFQLAPKVVPIGEVVRQAVESLRPKADALGLTLACFVDPGVPAAALLDGERFRQVLTNLVGNALKFTERGGVTVALQAERTTGAALRLRLVVRDTGPGIPPAQQHRLFIAFSRLEATAAKEGSGLGLALSSAICRAMGGELTVESDGQTGSVFRASFLAEPAELFSLKPVPRGSSTLQGRRVLVVDDNRLLRELFMAFLTENGATCASAASGRDALAQIGSGQFDAVILDLALPDGDSTLLMPALRACLPSHARVIGVSAHAGTSDRARVLAAGMDQFLTKPVPLEVLASALFAQPRPLSAPDPDASAQLLERLKEEFRRDVSGHRRQIQSAIDSDNWQQTQSLAHYLKNSAAVIRDDALFEACTGLEQAAWDADAEAVGRWWARCQQCLSAWGEAPPTPFPAA